MRRWQRISAHTKDVKKVLTRGQRLKRAVNRRLSMPPMVAIHRR
jgi:hypothetical protein